MPERANMRQPSRFTPPRAEKLKPDDTKAKDNLDKAFVAKAAQDAGR